MNKTNSPVDRIKMGLGIVLLAALTGCVGYVGGGPRGVVVVPGPDMYIFGGGYERGRDAREYSHRGVESRAAAHPVIVAPQRSAPQARPAASSPAHPVRGEPEKKR